MMFTSSFSESSNRQKMPFFRRQAQPKDDIITVPFHDTRAGHVSPSRFSKSNPTPSSLQDALSLSALSPLPLKNIVHSKTNSTNSFTPGHQLERSEYFLELKKSPSANAPVSRKSAWGRTIRTEKPGEDAFESDAFAVQMPTTREPIFDVPREASVFRTKISAPSKAQMDAYQTYKHKAQQVRARNNSEGVRVPSKLMSYDYASASRIEKAAETSKMETRSPAGSFPQSPLTAQHAWATSATAQASRKRFYSDDPPLQGLHLVQDPSDVPIRMEPEGLDNATYTPNPRNQYGDSVTGASISPPVTPPKIKIRLVPRPVTSQAQAQPDPPQKESHETLYNRSTPSSSPSAEHSRSSSPAKNNPQFAYTTSASEEVKATNDAVFGYTSNPINGTVANPKRTFAELPKDREKRKRDQKRILPSRWAWLRPAGPRVAKPSPTVTPPVAATKKPKTASITNTPTTYIDPFVQHATPPPSIPTSSRPATRPSSPRKLARAAPPGPSPKGKFETGFAQMTSFFGLVIKLCLVLYALVAVYFVLDAVREAVHALGAPFRVLRTAGGYLGVVMLWVWKWFLKGWDRWGVKIALKGGWKSVARKWWQGEGRSKGGIW